LSMTGPVQSRCHEGSPVISPTGGGAWWDGCSSDDAIPDKQYDRRQLVMMRLFIIALSFTPSALL